MSRSQSRLVRSTRVEKTVRRSLGAVARAAVTGAEALERRVLFAAVTGSSYQQVDIGTVPTPGTASATSGTYTVTGSGAAIFYQADAFHYVYTTLTGDGNFITQYQGQVAGNANNGTAGIDLRTSLDPGATNMFLGVRATGEDFVNARNGDSTDTSNIYPPNNGIANGTYLKLARAGNTVTAQTSTDGVTYTTIATETFDSLPSTVDVGLAVNSAGDDAPSTLTAANVSANTVTSPTATLSTTPGTITTAQQQINFQVHYQGPADINTATLGAGAVTVTEPNGDSIAADYDGMTGSGGSIFANYHIGGQVANGTYTITQKGGTVADVSGNQVAGGTLGTFAINIPDVTAPTSTLTSAPNVPSGTNTPYTFTVTYHDENQVQANTIGDNNVTVTGPNGYSHVGTLVTQNLTDAGTIAATYTVPAPTVNGTYTIAQNNTVTDTSGNHIAGATLGTFTASVDTTAPTVALTSAPTTTTTVTTPYQFTVTYSDNTQINAASIGSGDLTVTGPGYTHSATLVSTGLANSSTVAATYSVPAFTTDGTYTIALNSQQVADISGNAVAARTVGTFTVGTPAGPGVAVISGTITTLNGNAQAGATVFLDTNHNGVLDTGETSATTDANGAYTLSNLAAGTYTVAETPAAGFTALQPAGGTQTAVATANATTSGVNFINVASNSGAGSDLVGVFTSEPAHSVLSGSKGTVKVRITNSGTGAAVGRPTVTLYASPDGSLNGATKITTVSAGAINLKTNKSKVVNVNFPYPSGLASGSYVLLAAVDSSNTIAETNEANNLATSTAVTIAPANKDLSATVRKISPTTITAGKKKTTETLLISNTGNVPATGNITVNFYESTNATYDAGVDTLVGSVTKHVNIKNGKSASTAFAFAPHGTTAGSNYLIAVVNSTGSIVESNTTNNTAVSATPLTFA